jgi:mRNA interferase MazF
LDGVKRGDLVVVALEGDHGKPRPALVVQTDLFEEHPSLTVAPVTSTIVDAPLFRVTVEPTAANGLRSVSQIMVDKLTTIRRDRIAQTLGSLPEDLMLRVNRALVLWLGIAA